MQFKICNLLMKQLLFEFILKNTLSLDAMHCAKAGVGKYSKGREGFKDQ